MILCLYTIQNMYIYTYCINIRKSKFMSIYIYEKRCEKEKKRKTDTILVNAYVRKKHADFIIFCSTYSVVFLLAAGPSSTRFSVALRVFFMYSSMGEKTLLKKSIYIYIYHGPVASIISSYICLLPFDSFTLSLSLTKSYSIPSPQHRGCTPRVLHKP